MKMTTSPRRQQLDSNNKLAAFLLLAAIAPHAVSALSLSNFQLITSSAVPINCILAYNQQLTGCTLSDFTQQQTTVNDRRRDTGNTCSLACQAGIALAQQTIQAVCGGGSSNSNPAGPVTSVMGVALSGDLVGLLCGGSEAVSNNDTTTTTVLQTLTPEAAAATTTAATATATTSNSNTLFFFSTIEPAGGLSAAATESTNGVAQAPAAAAATATPGLETQSFVQNTNTAGSEAASSRHSGNGNAAPPSPTIATASLSQGAHKTKSSASSSTSSSSANDRNLLGGGGSPFDEAATNSGAERTGRLVYSWTQPWMMLGAAAVAAAAGGVLFR